MRGQRGMYDVTIIGAGLAGLQLARLLASGGAAVLLVDAKRNVTDRVRTTGIFVRRTFEDYPALDPFLGPGIRTIGLHSPAGRAIELTSPYDEFRVGRMPELYRAMLQDAQRAGAECRPGGIYAGMRRDPRGIRLVLRDGTVVKTRFVAGADGARSRVAADLALDRNTRWITGVEHVYPSVSTLRPRFDCWVDPAVAPGYLAWCVDDGEDIHVGVGGDRRRFDPAGALRTFETRLRADGRIPETTPPERRGGLIPVNGVLRRIACREGLLVGDAAGAVSPLTAGGLDACMRLSSHAARVLLRARDDPEVMATYSGAAYRNRFASRLRMRRLFDIVTRWPPATELGFALAGTGLLDPFIGHVFFGRGSFPDVEPAPDSWFAPPSAAVDGRAPAAGSVASRRSDSSIRRVVDTIRP